MKVIRITKEFGFEMAHALYGHDGACKNIHGHSYKLFVTIKGRPISQEDHPKNGMVMDFSDLKKIVNEEIVDPLDHALLLNSNSPQSELMEALKGKGVGMKIVYVDYPTTCESMLPDFADKIKKRLPDSISLHSIKLYETATSYAEWFAEDND